MSRAMSGNRVSSLVVNTRAPKSKNRSTALTASSAARRRRGTRVSAPALIGQVVVAPGVEHEEAPEDLAMVAAAPDVFGHQSRNRHRIEEASPRDPCRREAILEDRPERPAQPRGDRDAEPLLAARH